MEFSDCTNANVEAVKAVPTNVPLSEDKALRSENSAVKTDSAKKQEDPPSQKSTSLKALSDGHSTVQINLQKALLELSEKEAEEKQLVEDAARQREKTWLLEERIRLLSEKVCCFSRGLERKEKKQETVFMEVADVKWKIHECKQFIEKVKTSSKQMQTTKEQRQKELAVFGKRNESACSSRKGLQEDIIRLTNYKTQLENGEVQVRAIQNGNKMMEMEQRKRFLLQAIEERSMQSEAMYVEIDEKEERVKRLRESLEKAKERHQSTLRDHTNHLGYLSETALRLQRSLDYRRARIDYGMSVPAPPPWPLFARSSGFQGGQVQRKAS